MKQERRQCMRIIEKFNGLPFKINGHGTDGFDCMGLIHAYLTELGRENVPDSFQGITLETYTDFYKADPVRGFEVLLKVFDILGEPVLNNSPVAGDLVVIRIESGALFPAIYAGNGNALAAIERAGVKIIPVAKGMHIITVRRP